MQMLHIAGRINKCCPKNRGFLDWNLFLRTLLQWLSSSKQIILSINPILPGLLTLIYMGGGEFAPRQFFTTTQQRSGLGC